MPSKKKKRPKTSGGVRRWHSRSVSYTSTSYIFDAGSGGVVSPWTPSPEDPALNPDQRKAAARHSKVCLGKVCHGAELPFVFGEIESAGKDEDFAVSRRISDLWARFIKDPQVSFSSNVSSRLCF